LAPDMPERQSRALKTRKIV